MNNKVPKSSKSDVNPVNIGLLSDNHDREASEFATLPKADPDRVGFSAGPTGKVHPQWPLRVVQFIGMRGTLWFIFMETDGSVHTEMESTPKS